MDSGDDVDGDADSDDDEMETVRPNTLWVPWSAWTPFLFFSFFSSPFLPWRSFTSVSVWPLQGSSCIDWEGRTLTFLSRLLTLSGECPKLTISVFILLLSIGCLLICKRSTNSVLECLNSTALGYLTEILKVYKPTSQLCVPDTCSLCLPSVHMCLFGRRSFSYTVPSVWNSLLCKVRSSNMLSSFKPSLKSYVFSLFYWCVHEFVFTEFWFFAF